MIQTAKTTSCCFFSFFLKGDNSGVDAPEGLRGSVAGGFLMGTGGCTRWNITGSAMLQAGLSTLRQRMAEVVQGIAQCKEPDGYIMAFPRNESHYHENPDYVTSWVTHVRAVLV